MLQEDSRIPLPVVAAIRRIGDDTRSGAAEILGHSVDVFSLLTTALQNSTDLDAARHAVLKVCVALARTQPDMAPLLNLANHVMTSANRAMPTDEIVRIAETVARDFVQRATRAAQATIAHTLELISDGATVLTHSRSSTVLAALRAAHRAGRRLQVIATESRPLCEGRALAEALASEGIRVTLIADAAASLVVERADFVLFGADRIMPDVLVNKIGTRLIALAARECSIKVIALCDTSKFIAAWPAVSEANRGRDELWPAAPPQVEIVNRYFEPTPINYFTGIVTEDGWLAPHEASRRAAQQSINESLLAALGNA